MVVQSRDLASKVVGSKGTVGAPNMFAEMPAQVTDYQVFDRTLSMPFGTSMKQVVAKSSATCFNLGKEEIVEVNMFKQSTVWDEDRQGMLVQDSLLKQLTLGTDDSFGEFLDADEWKQTVQLLINGGFSEMSPETVISETSNTAGQQLSINWDMEISDELFDEKLLTDVIWEKEKEISEEFSDVIWDRQFSDELVPEGVTSFGEDQDFEQEVLDKLSVVDLVTAQMPNKDSVVRDDASQVGHDELHCYDTVWDEDIQSNKDLHCDLLKQLAMGNQNKPNGVAVGEKQGPIHENDVLASGQHHLVFSADYSSQELTPIVTKDEGAALVKQKPVAGGGQFLHEVDQKLDKEAVLEETYHKAVAWEDIPSDSQTHDNVLQQLVRWEEDVPQNLDLYNNHSEKCNSVGQEQRGNILTNVGDLPLFLQFGSQPLRKNAFNQLLTQLSIHSPNEQSFALVKGLIKCRDKPWVAQNSTLQTKWISVCHLDELYIRGSMCQHC